MTVLAKDTFKTGRQYSKDELTAYFADAVINEFRRDNKNYIVVDGGHHRWTFVQNHLGKYELRG